jgi:EF-P beta-lysylation protein EpmB
MEIASLIPRTSQAQWQRDLAQAIRDPLVLMQQLHLAPTHISLEAAQQFRLVVPQSYVARMRQADWYDPLLRQVLPLSDELKPVAGYAHDPVGDQYASVAEGVLHKYQGRVLLVTTGACAIHCRYCFRRHFPYQAANPLKDEWTSALSYIREHTDVREVILSGGDPLALSDERLAYLFSALNGISHIQRIRIHTRLPVVLPSRIDTNFLRLIQQQTQQIVMVLHINHAQELAATDVAQALQCLKASNLTLLNQSVLLRGVNDSAQALIELSEALFHHGILPYYLHVLDQVVGAAHFQVPDAQAIHLIQQVRHALPGFLVPKLVRETAGQASKTPLEMA